MNSLGGFSPLFVEAMLIRYRYSDILSAAGGGDLAGLLRAGGDFGLKTRLKRHTRLCWLSTRCRTLINDRQRVEWYDMMVENNDLPQSRTPTAPRWPTAQAQTSVWCLRCVLHPHVSDSGS